MITEKQQANRYKLARFMHEKVLPLNFNGRIFDSRFKSVDGCLIYHAARAGVLPENIMRRVTNESFEGNSFMYNPNFRNALDAEYGKDAAQLFGEVANSCGKSYARFYAAMLHRFNLQRTDVEFVDMKSETVRYYIVEAKTGKRTEVSSEAVGRKELAILQKYGMDIKLFKVKCVEFSEELK